VSLQPEALVDDFPAIRKGVTTDAQAIAAVFDEAVRDGWTWLGEITQSPMFSAADWDKLVADHQAPNVLLVAVGEPDDIIGFAALHPQDGELFLMFVRPDYWRCGIGRRLLEAAHEELRAAGCQYAKLFTHVCNERAIAAYQAVGYRGDGFVRDSEFLGIRIKELRLVKIL
jgi:ribosomal protein S18 acetylase RimI-like enzyme